MTYVKWLVGVLVLAALVYGGFHWFGSEMTQARTDGATTERGIWQAKEALRDQADLAATQLQGQAAVAKATFQQATNLKVDQDHAQALQNLKTQIAVLDAKRKHDGGLRVSRSICTAAAVASGPTAAGPAEAASNGSDDAYLAGTVALPDATERDLRSLEIEADKIVEDYRSTQAWIREQGFYGAFKMPTAPVDPASAVAPAGAPAAG